MADAGGLGDIAADQAAQMSNLESEDECRMREGGIADGCQMRDERAGEECEVRADEMNESGTRAGGLGVCQGAEQPMDLDEGPTPSGLEENGCVEAALARMLESGVLSHIAALRDDSCATAGAPTSHCVERVEMKWLCRTRCSTPLRGLALGERANG